MMKKDMLGIRELPKEVILDILEEAKKLKPKIKDIKQRDNTLYGTSLTTLFYENSTRTKISFLLAGQYLGALTSDLNISTSSVEKGETLIDTGATLDAMGTNIIAIRHGCTGAAHLLAKNVSACVINGGDGSNEHPTQALLDMFTMWEHMGTIAGLDVTIAGDVNTSRVARSNLFALTKLGANVTVAGPSTLVSSGLERLGVAVTTDVEAAVQNADVVMGLRIQKERQKDPKIASLNEYTHFFGINQHILERAKEKAIIMHPGPVNRGVELDALTIDSKKSVIKEQVENGIAVRMAVLAYLIN